MKTRFRCQVEHMMGEFRDLEMQTSSPNSFQPLEATPSISEKTKKDSNKTNKQSSISYTALYFTSPHNRLQGGVKPFYCLVKHIKGWI